MPKLKNNRSKTNFLARVSQKIPQDNKKNMLIHTSALVATRSVPEEKQQELNNELDKMRKDFAEIIGINAEEGKFYKELNEIQEITDENKIQEIKNIYKKYYEIFLSLSEKKLEEAQLKRQSTRDKEINSELDFKAKFKKIKENIEDEELKEEQTQLKKTKTIVENKTENKQLILQIENEQLILQKNKTIVDQQDNQQKLKEQKEQEEKEQKEQKEKERKQKRKERLAQIQALKEAGETLFKNKKGNIITKDEYNKLTKQEIEEEKWEKIKTKSKKIREDNKKGINNVFLKDKPAEVINIESHKLATFKNSSKWGGGSNSVTVDPSTGVQIDDETGYLFFPSTRIKIDPSTGIKLVTRDPSTKRKLYEDEQYLIEPLTGIKRNKETGEVIITKLKDVVPATKNIFVFSWQFIELIEALKSISKEQSKQYIFSTLYNKLKGVIYQMTKQQYRTNESKEKLEFEKKEQYEDIITKIIKYISNDEKYKTQIDDLINKNKNETIEKVYEKILNGEDFQKTFKENEEEGHLKRFVIDEMFNLMDKTFHKIFDKYNHTFFRFKENARMEKFIYENVKQLLKESKECLIQNINSDDIEKIAENVKEIFDNIQETAVEQALQRVGIGCLGCCDVDGVYDDGHYKTIINNTTQNNLEDMNSEKDIVL